VVEAVGYVGRYSRVHCRERSTVEGEGLKWSVVGDGKSIASGLSLALKAHPDFIGNSPFEMTAPQRFTIEG
jgi:hypothetical protein